MPKNPDPWPKGRYLAKSSPLVAGGKARLMSNRKVTPNRAKPREVSESEMSGYTDQLHRALPREPECLDEADYDRYIAPRASQDAAKRLKVEEQAREQAKRLLSQEERLVEAQREAKARRRDVSREVWLVERLTAKGKADQAERRLQALERIAYLGRAA